MVLIFYLVLLLIAQLWNKASAALICLPDGALVCKEATIDPTTSTRSTTTPRPSTTTTSTSTSTSEVNTSSNSESTDGITIPTAQGTNPASTAPTTSPASGTSPTRKQTDTFISKSSPISQSGSTVATPQFTPRINFLLDILTTCEPAKLRWTGSDTDNLTFNLTISSNDKSELPLANAISASANVYDWPKVTIPQGKYALNALDEFNTRTIGTGPFLVENGTDVSCLVMNETLNGTSIERPNPTSSTSPSSSPSQSNPVTPSNSSLNIPVIIGATVGSGLFLVIVLLLGYRCLQRKRRHTKPEPINPYPVEYTKSSELGRSKFRNDEESESSNDAVPAQEPEIHPRIHRHLDSGWRPQPPPSESIGSSLIHMPPEYENAL